MTDAEINILKALSINMPGADRDAAWLAAAERIRGICAERDELRARLALVEPLVLAAKDVRRGNYSVRTRLEYEDRKRFDEFNQAVDALLVAEQGVAAEKERTP